MALGLICGTAPGWLFVIAALGGPGPLTASLIYALPVLASTTLAVWIAVRLLSVGVRSGGITVGVVTLVVGILAYPAWIYLLALGLQYGDGPV